MLDGSILLVGSREGDGTHTLFDIYIYIFFYIVEIKT